MKPKNCFTDSLFVVHVLVCIFGIASWIDINGLWVELPLLVTVLPESWNLPSYMIIVIQIANIGPLIFGIVTYIWKDKKLESNTSILIITIGLIACILLAFFWHETTFIAGEVHSTALLTLNFLLATVDCTSSMAFLAFMSSLKPHYMSSYFIGEGLSGMIPSLTALAQGAGKIQCVNGSSTNSSMVNGTWHNETTYNVYPVYLDARFSVQVFFLILGGMMLCSLLSFFTLKFHPHCKSAYTDNSRSFDLPHTFEFKVEQHSSINGKTHPLEAVNTANATGLTSSSITILLLEVAWINLLASSFLLALQTYSCLPYGIEIYHLSVTLTNIANPLACFMTMFIPIFSLVGIASVTILGTLCGTYIIVCASLSPVPPLVHHESGGAVMVTVWVICIFLLTYGKVGVANLLRQGGRRPLILCGAFTQIGSFIGAIVGYILINIYHLFTDAPYC